MTETERKTPSFPSQEQRAALRAERNARLQAHRDSLRAQREWKEAHEVDVLAQKRYREAMAQRTGGSPIPPVDTSEQA